MKPPPRHLKTGARLMLHPLPLAAALLFALSALLLDGCASHPAPLRGRPDLLSFLADGKTTRTEAISHLGEPSGRFEQERILTYRLGFESRNQGYFVVEREPTDSGWPLWTRSQFSLVLVFDEQGVLAKHNLVRVNK